MSMTLSDLTEWVRKVNTDNGWRDNTEEALTGSARANALIKDIALIDTEAAEGIEEVRNGNDIQAYYSDGTGERYLEPKALDGSLRKPEGLPSELADVVIRAVDTADKWGIDLESAIEVKMRFNASRGHRHGGKVA